MKTITLGRDFDQPFKINQPGVSAQHARLTISEENGHEVWTLEDLGSANGTAIRNQKGETIPISKKRITPDTLICLGPDNANGCKFYARHAVDANSYHAEFDYLEKINATINDKLDNLDKKSKKIRMSIGIISAVTLVASLTELENSLRMMLLRLGTFASMLSSFLYDPTKEKKKIKEQGDKLFVCPNPGCSHTLSSREIQNRRCSKCKAQG